MDLWTVARSSLVLTSTSSVELHNPDRDRRRLRAAHQAGAREPVQPEPADRQEGWAANSVLIAAAGREVGMCLWEVT